MTSMTLYSKAKRGLHRLDGVRRIVRRALSGRPGRPVGDRVRAIPRVIWIYWDSGEEAAPPLVRRCIRSWREANPGWEVRMLDAGNWSAWADLPDLPASVSPAHFADVLRTRLLARHGGVWADATAFCTRPLSDWLPMLAGQSGFFAFLWIPGDRAFLGEGPGRTIGNWFLASEPGGAIIAAWDRETARYWDGRAAADSYFWHNDAFEWLVMTDRAARRAWARTPRMGALTPHLAWHHLETGAAAEALEAALAAGAVPVHKLSWRMTCPVGEIEALLAPGMAPDTGTGTEDGADPGSGAKPGTAPPPA